MQTLFDLPFDLMEVLTNKGAISFGVVVFFATVIASLKIFSKADEKWWKALIPIYNVYILTKISFHSGLLCLIYLIPGVNVIFYVIHAYKLSKVFGHGIIFALGLIFLEPLFVLILGFGRSKYRRKQK